MKRLSDQTLYEILEVSVEAPPEEIERAYQRAQALYGPGSLATYSLMSSDEATLLTNRIEEAKVVLLDADARARYDERIGVRARPALTPPPGTTHGLATPWPPPERPASTPVPEAAVASSTTTVVPEPGGRAPIVLQTPIAPAPPAPPPAQPAQPAPPPPAAEAAPPSPPPPAEPVQLSIPVSPGATALTTSPVGQPGPAPAAAPIPLKHEVAAPKELLVPEGSAWTGEMLRQVREARGLTVLQIADRTKVTRHHIENIEGDRFSALPASVYLRGILMSLARELRLDGQRVARSYLERLTAAQAAAPAKK